MVPPDDPDDARLGEGAGDEARRHTVAAAQVLRRI